MKTFPKGFLWGSAMSAPQTEGHSLQNGKSKTTWDYWYEIAPEVFQVNQGPENTSNLYELYEGDCKRMKEVGLNSIRTSISWARLLPDGKTLNQEAVAFYRDYFQKIKNKALNLSSTYSILICRCGLWKKVVGKQESLSMLLHFMPKRRLNNLVTLLKHGPLLMNQSSMWNVGI